MKEILDNLDKAFSSKVRLGIMSVIMVQDWVDFKHLKQTLDVSYGNLSSHIVALEKVGYLEIKKTFVGKKPNTSYRVTPSGRKAFGKHLDALEQLLKFKN